MRIPAKHAALAQQLCPNSIFSREISSSKMAQCVIVVRPVGWPGSDNSRADQASFCISLVAGNYTPQSDPNHMKK